MPLLTVPREIVLRILMALAPDYAALCDAAQTCTALRDMEASDREVLWKHMCKTLIRAQAQRTGPHATPEFAPRMLAAETQARLAMDSKTTVRLNHAQVRFGLPGTINAFTVQAFEEEFDFLLEVQYRDPSQNFSAPLLVLKRDTSLPDRSLTIDNVNMDWTTPEDWSTATRTFADVLRVVLLARDKVKNATTTVLIGFDPRPYDEDDDAEEDDVAVTFTFQCAVHEAWGMVRDTPEELHVFAYRTATGFDNVSVEIYSTVSPGAHLGLYDLANVVRSRQMPWVPCA